LGVRSHVEYIKLLLQLIRFDYFCSLVRTKTRLQFLTNANKLEILANNRSLDIIRITQIHSLGGGTYQTTYAVTHN